MAGYLSLIHRKNFGTPILSDFRGDDNDKKGENGDIQVLDSCTLHLNNRGADGEEGLLISTFHLMKRK